MLRKLIENPIAEFTIKDFGAVKLTLKSYLDDKGITRNQLATYSGIKYQTVDRYYRSEKVERVDLTLLAKMCYVLNCDIGDLLKYEV